MCVRLPALPAVVTILQMFLVKAISVSGIPMSQANLASRGEKKQHEERT